MKRARRSLFLRARAGYVAMVVVPALALAGVAACAGGPGDSDDGVGESAPAPSPKRDANAPIRRTVVRFDADGTQHVSFLVRTRAEQAADVALALDPQEGRALGDGLSQATSADTTQNASCAYGSLWLFDQPNYAGNDICFYYTGSGETTANLGLYVREILQVGQRTIYLYWYGAPQSFIAGYSDGELQGSATFFQTGVESVGANWPDGLIDYCHLGSASNNYLAANIAALLGGASVSIDAVHVNAPSSNYHNCLP